MLGLVRSPKIFLWNQSLIFFSKKTRPQIGAQAKKEKSTSRAYSDDKAAKISQQEQEQQQKKEQESLSRKKQEDEERRTQPKMKTWNIYWEEHIHQPDLLKIRAHKFPIYYKPELQKPLPDSVTEPVQKQVAYSLNQENDAQKRLHKKVPINPWNVADEWNKQFLPKMKPHDYSSDPFANPVRAGLIATKVGMTGIWDKWGYRHALTVVQLDRNQVVQVKTREYDGVDSVQIGAGDANIKKITKPLIGHFVKNDIPPKRFIHEFPITPENVLPVGFMLTARHFTPGQLVDAKGVSNGKGFSGTIKRWGFRRQPATHGNSLSHRVAGSTGQRQDPGRVFKGKKMAGQLGNEKVTVECLKVILRMNSQYSERQLIYLKGSIPGKNGTVVYLRDSIKKAIKNAELINYPTFIPKDNLPLATEITMSPPDVDPEEFELHDNDIVKGGDEEDG